MDLATDFSDLSPRAVTRNSLPPLPARSDKSLKSVARSIAKRLGCSRVSLFANARALDESLTVGALAASGVGRVEAVPCDDAPAVVPAAPAPPPLRQAEPTAPTAP